jgi:hypothetical protein
MDVGAQPEALAEESKSRGAGDLDAVGRPVRPQTWVVWEEDFDPLAGTAMLLQVELVNDGSDP